MQQSDARVSVRKRNSMEFSYNNVFKISFTDYLSNVFALLAFWFGISIEPLMRKIAERMTDALFYYEIRFTRLIRKYLKFFARFLCFGLLMMQLSQIAIEYMKFDKISILKIDSRIHLPVIYISTLPNPTKSIEKFLKYEPRFINNVKFYNKYYKPYEASYIIAGNVFYFYKVFLSRMAFDTLYVIVQS